MSRFLRPLLVCVFLALGAGLGALNAAPVAVDLAVLRFESPLGLLMLGSLLAGVLLALTVSVVLPMRRRWRSECAALRTAQTEAMQADSIRADSIRAASVSTRGSDGIHH
jgi:uncharacterized integral membrane protein